MVLSLSLSVSDRFRVERDGLMVDKLFGQSDYCGYKEYP